MRSNDAISKIRSENRRAILHLIRQSGPISRVQLAQRLKLSKSTITENITPMLQTGVVKETGVASSHATGGRRPVLLHINGNFRYIIAAELGLREPIFALAGLNGKILLKRTLPLPDDAPYIIRFKACKEMIRQLLRDGNIPKPSLSIIALSSPGAYSAAQDSFQLNPEFENWKVDQLTNDLEEAFSTDVFRVNDVNAATIGEYYKGAGKGCHSMMYISCGVGVGVGMVLNGMLYTGLSGSAGEIARVKVAKSAKPLRTQVEISALMERIKNGATSSTLSIVGGKIENLDFPAVVKLWQQGNAFVRSCTADIATTLGEVLAFTLSLLNCERVVLGGDYLVFEEQFLPIINSILQVEAFDPVLAVASRLRQDAGIEGLLSLAADSLLERTALERDF